MNMNFPWKSEEGLRGTAYAVGLVTFLFLVELFIYLTLHHSVGVEENRDLIFQLQQMTQTAELELDKIVNDLRYLSHLPLCLEVIENPEAPTDPNLIALVKSMMTLDGSYDQVRILNSEGMEVFRMNQGDDGRVYQVPFNDLQDKSQRYYFTETMALTGGQLYVSPFDLNMEQGQIEQPIKPMLRFGAQIQDAQGQIRGVIMINYLGERVFQAIEPLAQSTNCDWYLLNHQGYYLRGPIPDVEWAFMYGREQGFHMDYPEIWNHMDQHGIIEDSQRGSFYYQTFSQLVTKEQGQLEDQLCLVLHRSSTNISTGEKILLSGIVVCFMLIAPILAFAGMRLGKSRFREEQHLKNIEKLASHDSMTGLLNRRAIYEILSKEVKLAHRQKLHHSVGFIDVNNLKRTNDKEGHDAGDILITKAAEAIIKSIRETDTPARIGGDEFLVSFPHCRKDEAFKVLERAAKWFEQEGIKYTGKPWSISYGTAEYNRDEDSLNDLIHRADSEMYEAKKKYKKSIGEDV